jgi:hypothetical protein
VDHRAPRLVRQSLESAVEDVLALHSHLTIC